MKLDKLLSIALFGGTFDPIHNGHINASINIQNAFHFDFWYFLPCNIPVLKSPSLATPEQRIKMLQLAIQDAEQFKIDLREINRSSPSYMVDTLTSIRAEHQNASITLIMGYDAFLTLPKWHQWKKIPDLANLLIINRNTSTNPPLPESVELLLKTHQAQRKSVLLEKPSGVITFFDAGDYNISSTEIRAQISQGIDVKDKIPKRVYQYINDSGLYR